MTPTTNTLLQEARTAIQAGRKEQAQALLQQAIRQNPDDYRAWLWLAGISRSPQASLAYVSRAAALRPNAPAVVRARAWAEKRAQEQQKPPIFPAPVQPTMAAAPTQTQAAFVPAPVARQPVPRPVVKPQTVPKKTRRLPVAAAVASFCLLLVIVAGLAWYNARQPDQAAGAGLTNVLADTKQLALGTNLGLSGPAATAPPAAPPLEPKNIIASAGEPRAAWTATPRPTSTPTPTPEPTATPSPYPTVLNDGSSVSQPIGMHPGERWIDVNLTSQTLNAYEGNNLVLTSLVSSGTWQFPTVTGQFRVYLRFQAQTMDGYRLGYDYYLPNVPYVMYFYEDYALHGTYWHNNFGRPMSHGCVNLPTPNAEWLYNWSTIGTLVNIHY